ADVALELEEAGIQRAEVQDGGFALNESDYQGLFAVLGIDVLVLGPEEAADRIRSGPIAWALIPALDLWTTFTKDAAMRDRLLAVVRVVDPESLRGRIRGAVANGRGDELAGLARSEAVLDLSPASLHLLARSLRGMGKNDVANSLLR